MITRRAGKAAGGMLLTAAVTLAGVAGSAPTASAAPAQRAAVFKVTFSGYSAMTAWTTCPDVTAQEVGTVCTGADLMAFLAATSEQAGSDVHLRDRRSGTVKTWDYTCVVEDVEIDPGQFERTCVLQSERFGRATGADVVADPHLDAVVVSATVPVQIVDHVHDSETTGTLDVEARFTGTGPTWRVDESTHWVDRSVMWLEGTRGWERACTAVATFDGVTVSGEPTFGSLSRVRQAEVRVYHGPGVRSVG